MNDYVILFRRERGPLDAAEQAELADAIAQWAAEHNAAGHALAPHLLGSEAAHVGAAIAAAPTVTALLMLRARDLDEAARVAARHPGAALGFSLEVRPWAAPGAAAR